ncbi:sulfite exporter TauE/SafE family protein [Parasalinivibrio latis]|uniref:sulfite exporter TauE/SafE family protein n=1 Tax=Parasalinivibrio latis TaxID=2952610 RepID=UPI0030E053A0
MATELIDLFNVYIVPEGVTATASLFLIILSFFTSCITATLGVGGGALLVAAMASILPTSAVIPVHGVVQLGSNVGRFAVMRKYVRYSVLGWFLAGSLLGAALGGSIVVSLPEHLLKLILGSFILLVNWFPVSFPLRKVGMVSIGALSNFISMFVGAPGPFLIATIRRNFPDRKELLGTMAAFMSIQHALKAAIFGFLGFTMTEWLPLIGIMITTGFLGTLTGRSLLEKISDKRYGITIKWVLTALAIRLIWQALAER